MFLEKLIVSSKNGLIRDIPFNLKGLNLVVDTTPTSKSGGDTTVSGNNVGKTTFIRSVDFCLGSNGKDIYTDSETKENNDVKNFLVENEVIFELTLLRKDKTRLRLQRSLIASKDLYIDGVKLKNYSEYVLALNQLIFHIPPTETKVSFRNLIKKFVRSDSYSEGNLYKILHHFTSDSVYEAMFLYLFGFPNQEVISERLRLTDLLDKAKKILKKTSGAASLPKIQSRLTNLQKFIEEKELAVKTIDLPATYDHLINQLKELKGVTAELSSSVGNLNSKISLSKKTKNELIESESKIDPIAIKQLYEEAKLILPSVQKPFEEILLFHNSMVKNKLSFVEQHIKKLENQRNKIKLQLDQQLIEQSHLLSLLDNTGTFDDLLKIREEINVLYMDKGQLMAQIKDIQKVQSEISDLEVSLAEVNLTFMGYLAELKSNLENIFNPALIQYTSETHDDKLFIFYDDENRKFGFDNLVGNVGHGYKKTEIIALDFAFITYFNELGLDFPLFTIHDKFEIVHMNQIKTIFEIADSLNGQFVVSVLKERIAFLGEDYINDRTILELSENEKFFKF
ncbi:DUF2326 domain-containing protein [Dyadobacter sp. 32]|uniref:DUF2326 domain-containing protein n=1 Tax=Dyadobacter sp. 32 TaxID=538966 RepID=UPI0011EE7A43